MIKETEDKAILEITDNIYHMWREQILSVHVIDRVTRTQAFSGNLKFQREFNPKYRVKLINEPKWSTSSYKIETQELKDALRKQKLVTTIKEVNWEEVNTETLESILNLLRAV